MFLTRDQILHSDDLQNQSVFCPEWGGEVLIWSLTAEQRDAFSEMCMMDGKIVQKNFRAKLVAQCIRDEQGQRVFSDTDIDLLGKKSSIALDRCFKIAKSLSGLSDEDVEEAKKN